MISENTVIRAKNGDKRALYDIFKEYIKKLYYLCSKVLDSNQSADELILGICGTLEQRLGSLIDVEDVQRWIMTIAMEKCAEKKSFEFKSISSGSNIDSLYTAPLVEEYEEDASQAEAVSKVISSFSVEERFAFLGYYFAQMPVTECAKTAKCSVDVMNQYICATTEKLNTADTALLPLISYILADTATAVQIPQNIIAEMIKLTTVETAFSSIPRKEILNPPRNSALKTVIIIVFLLAVIAAGIFAVIKLVDTGTPSVEESKTPTTTAGKTTVQSVKPSETTQATVSPTSVETTASTQASTETQPSQTVTTETAPVETQYCIPAGFECVLDNNKYVFNIDGNIISSSKNGVDSYTYAVKRSDDIIMLVASDTDAPVYEKCFNAQGLPVKYSVFRDGKVDYYFTYEYNKSVLIKKSRYINDKLDSEYTVNSDGQTTTHIKYNTDGNVLNKNVYKYTNGNVAQRTTYDRRGNIIYDVLYKYDEKGSLVREIIQQGSASIYITYASLSSTLIYTDADTSYKTESKYNEAGNCVEEIRYDGNDNVSSTCVYEFNAQGYPIKKTTVVGTIINTELYEYQYNALGKPSKRISADTIVTYEYYEDGTLAQETEYTSDGQRAVSCKAYIHANEVPTRLKLISSYKNATCIDKNGAETAWSESSTFDHFAAIIIQADGLKMRVELSDGKPVSILVYEESNVTAAAEYKIRWKASTKDEYNAFYALCQTTDYNNTLLSQLYTLLPATVFTAFFN